MNTRDQLIYETFHAAYEETAASIQRILDQRPELLHVRNQCGETLLHAAVGQGFHELVILLLKRGLDPNSVALDGSTPLSITRTLRYDCAWEEDSTVKALIEYGAKDTNAN